MSWVSQVGFVGRGNVPDAALSDSVCVGENVGVDGFGVEFGGGNDEGAE